MCTVPYKIATLIFMENEHAEQLLLHRHQSPNKGLWTPIGGKLDTRTGESPVQCAIREAREETGIDIKPEQLHLFGYLAEANYEGQGHWLIFLFHYLCPVKTLPSAISEGVFAFHPLECLPDLPLPPSDHDILWPVFLKNRKGFTGIRIQYQPPESPKPYQITIEQENHFSIP